MGGRGTFGTHDSKLDRNEIIASLAMQGTKVAIDGKVIVGESSAQRIKSLTNSDLSILKDFIGKPNAKAIVNLTSNFNVNHIGKSVYQEVKTRSNGQQVNVVQINRNLYKNRGLKFFNNNLKNEQGYSGGIKNVPLNRPPKITKPTKNKKVIKKKKKVE